MNKESTTTDEFSFHDAARVLLQSKQDGADVVLVSPQGLRYARLRYVDLGHEIMTYQILFTRSAELKPYYAKIRNWFASHNIEWADRTIGGVKYLSGEKSASIDNISVLLESIQDDIFGFKKTRFESTHSGIRLRILGLSNIYILMFSAFALIPAWIGLVLYELINLDDLRMPSIGSVSKTEIFLTLVILICAFNLFKFNRDKGNNAQKASKLKIWAFRAVMLSPIVLAFFTC